MNGSSSSFFVTFGRDGFSSGVWGCVGSLNHKDWPRQAIQNQSCESGSFISSKVGLRFLSCRSSPGQCWTLEPPLLLLVNSYKNSHCCCSSTFFQSFPLGSLLNECCLPPNRRSSSFAKAAVTGLWWRIRFFQGSAAFAGGTKTGKSWWQQLQWWRKNAKR